MDHGVEHIDDSDITVYGVFVLLATGLWAHLIALGVLGSEEGFTANTRVFPESHEWKDLFGQVDDR